jgi:hypothetical protein
MYQERAAQTVLEEKRDGGAEQRLLKFREREGVRASATGATRSPGTGRDRSICD